MTIDLLVVSATETGCLIQKDHSCGFVVSHQGKPAEKLRVPTLASAYATCRDWERCGTPVTDRGTVGASTTTPTARG